MQNRWTHEEVTDEMLLAHWSKLIRHVTYKVVNTYKMSEADREDIVADIQLRLLKMPQAHRVLSSHCKMVINTGVRESIMTTMCNGATPRALWRDYSTLDYSSAAPGPQDGEESPEDVDRLFTPESPEASLVDNIALETAIGLLSKDEQAAVRNRYWGEGPHSDWYVLRRALKKLRVSLA